MRRLLLAVVAAGTLACNQPRPHAAFDSRAPSLRAAEDPALALPNSRAVRHGDTLVLALSGGSTLRLVDDTTEGDRYVRYIYRGPLSGTRLHMIEAGFYESGVYLLVDDTTGHKTFVDDAPIASPNGTLVAVASMDMEAGYEPNRLTLYATSADSLSQVWRQESKEWGPEGIAWHGNDSLMVVQAFPTDSGPGSYTHRTAWLLRAGKRWSLTSPRQ